MKQIKKAAVLAGAILSLWVVPTYLCAADQIPAFAPLNHTHGAGKGGVGAAQSVVRVRCLKDNTGGTGFIHVSGYIITAAHVVSGCEGAQIDVVGVGINGKLNITAVAAKDDALDLAVLKTEKKVTVPLTQILAISSRSNLTLGDQVTTWGYPDGYGGAIPLLSVGYLAGQGQLRNPDKSVSPNRWFVNAAFNSGNSGGPLLRVEDGTVIGVVISKLAPVPDEVESILQALKNQKAGFTYTRTYPDGRKETLTEGQVVHEVLQYLRRQTQLVIGHAVMLGDLRKFLEDNKIEP